MRIGKERKSPWKTDVPKLYAYNECEHSVKKANEYQGLWVRQTMLRINSIWSDVLIYFDIIYSSFGNSPQKIDNTNSTQKNLLKKVELLPWKLSWQQFWRFQTDNEGMIEIYFFILPQSFCLVFHQWKIVSYFKEGSFYQNNSYYRNERIIKSKEE